MLYFTNCLLTNYGKNPTITEFLDARGFCFIAVGSPGAFEQILQESMLSPEAVPFDGGIAQQVAHALRR